MVIYFAPVRLISRSVLGLAFVLTATLADAQGLFTPAKYVNDDAITNYELQQRVQLLQILRTSGDLEQEALTRLINERLQKQAAGAAGISPSEQEITAGVDEFAGRNDLSGAQFLESLAQQGVAPESFRDFVATGIAWRQLVRDRFLARSRVSDAEIDRAIDLSGTTGSARVQISEIFLPMNTPENETISLQLAPQISQLTSFEEFANAARRFSAGPSRDQGGRVETWVPLENLPPQIRSVLLTMRPGQVTEPIEIPNALALFQLRAVQETTTPRAPNPLLDYATYFIAGGQSPAARARAAQVRARVDNCDDLFAVARDQPANVLQRNELALQDIPADIALELAKLDAGEVSTSLTSADGANLVFLMLCKRTRNASADISRDDIRRSLSNQRLADLAQALLDELRANASIRNP